MTDLDVAMFLIKAASVADGGCLYCAQRVVSEGIRTRPNLPWGIAAKGLVADDPNYVFAIHAVEAATVGDRP